MGAMTADPGQGKGADKALSLLTMDFGSFLVSRFWWLKKKEDIMYSHEGMLQLIFNLIMGKLYSF